MQTSPHAAAAGHIVFTALWLTLTPPTKKGSASSFSNTGLSVLTLHFLFIPVSFFFKVTFSPHNQIYACALNKWIFLIDLWCEFVHDSLCWFCLHVALLLATLLIVEIGLQPV